MRAALLALALLVPLAAGAERVRVEAIGSVPLGAASRGGAPARQEALEAGIRDAVVRSALELARQAGSNADEAAVRAALGDPKSLAAGYRILEDRGERAPLLESSPGAEREYVVAVEVEVERGLVRARLAQAGLLASAPSPSPDATRRIVLEGVDSWALWIRIRDALAARGSPVQALEFAPGRILALLGAEEAAGSLVARLGAGLGDAFHVEPLGGDRDALRIGISRRPPSDEAAPAGPEGAGEAPDVPAPR